MSPPRCPSRPTGTLPSTDPGNPLLHFQFTHQCTQRTASTIAATTTNSHTKGRNLVISRFGSERQTLTLLPLIHSYLLVPFSPCLDSSFQLVCSLGTSHLVGTLSNSLSIMRCSSTPSAIFISALSFLGKYWPPHYFQRSTIFRRYSMTPMGQSGSREGRRRRRRKEKVQRKRGSRSELQGYRRQRQHKH